MAESKSSEQQNKDRLNLERNRRASEENKDQKPNQGEPNKAGKPLADLGQKALKSATKSVTGNEVDIAKNFSQGNYKEALNAGLKAVGQRGGQALGAFLGLPPNIAGAIGQWLAGSKVGKIIVISIILISLAQLLLIMLLPFIIVVVVMSGGMIAMCSVSDTINSAGLSFFCGLVNAIQ